MINPYELGRKPNYPDLKVEIPFATSDIIQGWIKSLIDDVRKNVEAPIRISGGGYSNYLFALVGGEDIQRWRGYKVDTQTLQNTSLMVMKEYGLDEEKFTEELKTTGGIAYPDGSILRTRDETRVYPSQTIPGLVFRRERECGPFDETTYFVEWEVEDRAPLLRIDLKRALTQLAARAVKIFDASGITHL